MYITTLLLLLFAVFSLFTDLSVRQRGGFFSDEAAYFSAVQSLAYDHDLEYTRRDLFRIKKEFATGPQGIFLKKGNDGRLFFAKSFIYPLAAAPFYRIGGVRGIFFFHFLLLSLVVLMAYRVARRRFGEDIALPSAIFFLFASIAWVYFFWITADLFNFSMVFLSYLFWFDSREREKPWLWIFLSALCIGLATFSKPPNALLALPLLVDALFVIKRPKRVLLFFLGGAVPTLLLFGLTTLLMGDWNFMGGQRKSFYFTFPFENPGDTFDSLGITMSAANYWQRFFLTPSIFLKNLFYFFFGRYTGLLFYMAPGLLFLTLFLLSRKKEKLGWVILAVFLAEIGIYTAMAPDNYFGGAGSLGNRYALNIYPLLFFLFPYGLNKKKLFLASCWSVLCLGPLLFDPIYYSSYTGELSKNGLFRLAPPELTQVASLPVNINPHVWRIPTGGGCYFTFLNNNFNKVTEGGGVWSYKEGELEFILEAPARSRRFHILLQNNPSPARNRVSLRIGDKRVSYTMGASEVRELTMEGIKPDLVIRDTAFYKGSLVSSTSTIPFFTAKENRDRRRVALFFKPTCEPCAE
ncbi:MAG TPA: glycosyltransferase family 39 protein [Candidatus Aminicenantes bacterium]|nr:glycosyltransferase family 39 protein [Candidatus Aminicenantes bacterium]